MSEPEQTVSFIGFVISLAHTAAVHFGDVAGPGDQAPGRRRISRRRRR